MSDSEDSYGPALPPGLQQDRKSGDDSSSDDQYGPALPKSFNKQSENVSINDGVRSKLPATKHDISKREVIGPVLPTGFNKTSGHSSDSDSDSSSLSSSSSSSSSGSDHRSRRKKKHRKADWSTGDTVKGMHTIGPAMPPPNMKQSGDDLRGRGKNVLGPTLAPGTEGARIDNTDESDDDVIGPSVGLQASEEDQSAVKDFESRSQRMTESFAASAKADDGDAPKQRESWMTELPEGMGASFGLGNRQFRTRDAPEIDSSWTEAPHEKGKKSKEGKKRKKDKDEHFRSDRDKKAKTEIEAYNKKHRPDSLLEMHTKEMKKKKKKEKKKNKDKTKERRPFDRDVDLKVNKFDDAMKKAYIKRSQELGSRFKSGGTGTSFL